MPFIGRGQAAGKNTVLLDAITTSATATYNLTLGSVAFTPIAAQSLVVSLNGVTQAPIAGYTVSGSQIVFATALTSNDVIDYIIGFEAISKNVTLTSIVTTEQIADDAVTTAKIADDAITAALIADNAVDIARLNVSDGSSGQVLTTNGSGTLSFATVGGAYSDWTILTTTPTALAAKGQYVCNDTTARTHTLPSGSAGATIIIANAGSATVTIARTSSQKINSAAEDGTLPQGNSVQLVYVDGTIGWFAI
tara:strand:+ start:36 stop:788 length:753 start_codon:yes stop_codon:yes gene_type:complete